MTKRRRASDAKPAIPQKPKGLRVIAAAYVWFFGWENGVKWYRQSGFIFLWLLAMVIGLFAPDCGSPGARDYDYEQGPR